MNLFLLLSSYIYAMHITTEGINLLAKSVESDESLTFSTLQNKNQKSLFDWFKSYFYRTPASPGSLELTPMVSLEAKINQYFVTPAQKQWALSLGQSGHDLTDPAVQQLVKEKAFAYELTRLKINARHSKAVKEAEEKERTARDSYFRLLREWKALRKRLGTSSSRTESQSLEELHIIDMLTQAENSYRRALRDSSDTRERAERIYLETFGRRDKRPAH